MSLVTATVALVACKPELTLQSSVAQTEQIRSGVTVEPGAGARTASDRDGAVRTVRRLSPGDTVRTDAHGRTTVSLDGGGRLLLDHDSALRVTGPRAAQLSAGRLWVGGGGEGGRQEETVLTVGAGAGGAVLHLRGARASVSLRSGGGAEVSVLAGEVAYESGTRRGAIRTGETATVGTGEPSVAAQTAWVDWTGGFADDDAVGRGGDSAGIGAVGARTPGEQGEPRWPMVMQRLDAHVEVRGDLAITTVDQTFFNPSAQTVEGLYTFNTPPGAVLQMFGVDRRGRIVEGRVQERQQAAAQYAAQVYQGSTHDPALLEWDAPGRYHAKLYPIPAGATRRIRVRYTQWLGADSHGRRTYRLPLSALESRVGELRADFDLTDANVTDVRAGTGARVEQQHVYIAQSDVLPRADLVVELQGVAQPEAQAIRVPSPGDPRGGYLRVAVQAPVEAARTPVDEGVDLVLVVDHSAATDELALRLEQGFVESVLGALDARDRVLVLAGDVSARAVGQTGDTPALQPASEENRRAIMDGLSRDHLGGATDLGAMLSAAHRALQPGRNGAIVYVGDGQATVGENTMPALRQLMGRLSPRPRFYAVAVGEEPRLDLLTGIAEPAGIAARVTRRAELAPTALRLVEHASRPLIRNVRVDLGPLVQTVYPAEPVDLPAGEQLTVVGRFSGELPRTARVRALWNGAEVSREVPIAARTLDDGGDLRYRWANARLESLLAREEPRAVVVELGVRYGLITPYTSLYVPSEDEVSALETQQRAQSVALARAESSSLSVFDLLPLVGCSRARSIVSGAAAPEEAPAPPAMQVAAASQNEGGTGTRHAGAEGRMGNRYAVRNNDAPPHLSREVAAEAARQQGVFAALAAPGGAAGGNGIVSPFGGLTESGMDQQNQPRPSTDEPARPAEPEMADRLSAGQMAQAPAAVAPAMPMAAPVVVAERAARRRGGEGEDDSRANGNMTGDAMGEAGGFGGLGSQGTGWGGGGTGEGTVGLGNFGTIGHGSGTGSGQGYGSGAGRGLRGRGSQGPLVRAAPPQVTGLLSPEAIRRVVLRNLGQVAHCHEQGLAQNPNAQGRVTIRFLIGGTGTVLGSNVAESTVQVPAVGQCIAMAVRRWQFPSPEGGGVVTVNYPFNLNAPEGGGGDYTPPPSNPTPVARPAAAPSSGLARCSDAAGVPLSERIGLWRERASTVASSGDALTRAYRAARRACELPAWADRVAYLRILNARAGNTDGQLAFYRELEGDRAARDWLRGVILRSLARTGELARAQELGLGRLDADTMTQALGRATTAAQRLSVLVELARRYPDDVDLSMRALDLAVELRAQSEVRSLATRLRRHPQADARVRTAAGEALFSVGDEAEARRTFSEIVEFAPDDPAARRRLGDIALSHGWADEAYRQFQMLAAQENDAPEVLLRQAMAARMANRLDEAMRLAERVASQSSSGTGEIAGAWLGVELALASQQAGADRETIAALQSRWRHSPAARTAGALRVVLRWFHPDDGAELYVTLPGETQRRADLAAGAVFFESSVFADAPGPIDLEVRRASGVRSHGTAELIVLVDEGTDHERIVRRELTLDEAHARFSLHVENGALTERAPPAPLAPEGTAPNGAAAATAGGAR